MKNRASLVSDAPDVVDVCAIEPTDTRDEGPADPYPVFFDNATAFNHLRGTESQLLLTSEGPDTVNMSRDSGDNRGHGAHPSALGRGGNYLDTTSSVLHGARHMPRPFPCPRDTRDSLDCVQAELVRLRVFFDQPEAG